MPDWIGKNVGCTSKTSRMFLSVRTSLGNRYDLPPVQQHDLIGKAGGEIQIMDHSHRHHVRSAGKAAHLFHKIDLMTDVEKGERLVKK